MPKRAKAKAPFKRVSVEWTDAYSIDPWTDVSELQSMIDKPIEHPDGCTGLLVAENADWIVIANASSLGSNGWMGAASMVIPRGMVKKIKVLK